MLVLSSACLIAGWKTKWATAFCWVLISSLHARITLSDFGGDTFLRILLFWGIFLPLGQRWVLDSRHGTNKDHSSINTVWTMAFTAQIIIIYLMTTLLKYGPSWRRDFNAIEHALVKDSCSTKFGEWLLQFPQILEVLTQATVFLEGVGPVLLLLPLKSNLVRLGVCVSFLSFHLLGIGLTMHIWIFPLVGAVAWLALLPSCSLKQGKREEGVLKKSWKETPFQVCCCVLLLSLVTFFGTGRP